MSFDNSRNTFDPWKDYAGVVMEQGRVQTDADWNDWLAEQLRRIQAGTLDTMGQAVYPATTPFAFQITPGSSSVDIGRGRMYVDGILVENHGDPSHATWDPALAELSGSPLPPSTSDVDPVPYEVQPYNSGAVFPTGAGDYLVYLDVWQQAVTYIEDPTLVDPAIGVDTSARLRTTWRVGTMSVPSGTTCAKAAPAWPQSAGLLTNGTVASGPSGPCCLTTGSGYTGVENQFYRVEIHNPGAAGGTGATFKWSRENASVQTTVTAFGPAQNTAGDPASQLTVTSLGRDQVLGFSAGDWVELTNETNDNQCQPGSLYQIDRIDAASKTITLTTSLPSGFTLGTDTYTRLIRWDQSGKVYKSDNSLWCDLDVVGSGPGVNGAYGIPVPTDGTALILENGIIVTFGLSAASGSYVAMDYWNFSARTATETIDPLTKTPPRGIHHHYAPLAIATVDSSGKVTNASDCRTPWPPAGAGDGGCCCTNTVGVGGKYSTIKDAIEALPLRGGEICLLPGEIYENVLLSGRRNIVIHGCGWQTHVYSASLAGGASTSSTAAPASDSGLAAVFTIVGCENIVLRSFSVTATDDEVGILMDRGQAKQDSTHTEYQLHSRNRGNIDVELKELILEASTLPAIVAVAVNRLKVKENLIFMEDVRSRWAAVYLSGEDIYFRHNWVGLGTARELAAKASEVETKAPSSNGDVVMTGVQYKKALEQYVQQPRMKITEAMFEQGLKAPGGIHIGGPSKDVFIVENEIAGGAGNGITLGRFIILNEDGTDSGDLTGVRWEIETDCTTTGTGQIPGTTESGGTKSRLAAGGTIQNLHIARNRIYKMGMAGIGVVGFWNLRETLEIISIENLSITENVIVGTMRRRMSAFAEEASGFAYGAITLADVENLVIRDNMITDFGYVPGADVCGIFVLHGQMVEISRNQIRETRDWDSDSLIANTSAGRTRAGILLYLVTPPEVDGSAWTASQDSQSVDWKVFSSDGRHREKPIYEPGLPAARIQENVVRMAIGLALEIFGYGSFSIVNNHFGSGGPIGLRARHEINLEYVAPSKESANFKDPMLVSIINLGLAIEDTNAGTGFETAYNEAGYSNTQDTEFSTFQGRANAGSGTVLFTNNICQLEAWASRVRGLASVAIMTFDHALFTNNQLWVDAPPLTFIVDAFVFGATAQMCDNRLQESRYYPVLASGFSWGIANITAHNIATYCLEILGPAKYRINHPNVILSPLLCKEQASQKIKFTPETMEVKGQ